MDSLNPYNPFKNKKKSAPFTQEQLDYIKQLLDSGWSVSRICQTYDLGKDAIKRRIKEDDWVAVAARRDTKLSEQELQEIKQKVDSNYSLELICSEYNISMASLLRRIQNNKWEKGRRKNIYNFNEHYFDNIDDEHKAYWLGFLTADGYILSARHREGRPHESQSFGFSISMKDKELFDYFKQDLEATNPVNVYKNSGSFNATNYCGRILLTSQHTVDTLKKYGIVENKTFITTMPEIEEHLIPAWIRGYSDGDGSISRDKNNRLSWGLCGTKELLTGIQEFFGFNYKLSQRFPERHNNNWSLKVAGWINVPSALSIIYKDATIYLKRKYDKYVEIQGSLDRRLHF